MLRHRGCGLLALAGLAIIAGKTPEMAAGNKQEKIRVLLIDGQNNHNWRATSPFMKKALEDTGRFVVDVATSPSRPASPQKPKTDDPAELAKHNEALAAFKEADVKYRAEMVKFQPDFGKYQVVLSNYNGDSWPKQTNDALDLALKEGTIGLVIVHAANNSFGGWKEYNQMIGMGWRDKNYGERLILEDDGKEVRVSKGQGDGSGHRYSGKFQVTMRDASHPVTKDMPREWLHNDDELYDNLRGPIENVHILATAFSKGTKAHEPMIWTVDYGKGRVFHTPMGHDLNGMRCIGFLTTLARGTEWAATGSVTLPIPKEFPTPDKTSTILAK
ncbi:MAG: ThuA domain-containing protein [Planctomycetes bacterium]|nr:ThuA domain-containing protein [Planctomycetota bacterium]